MVRDSPKTAWKLAVPTTARRLDFGESKIFHRRRFRCQTIREDCREKNAPCFESTRWIAWDEPSPRRASLEVLQGRRSAATGIGRRKCEGFGCSLLRTAMQIALLCCSEIENTLEGCLHCDETFDFCFLFCVCHRRFECADVCVATVAWTYASADMAKEGA